MANVTHEPGDSPHDIHRGRTGFERPTLNIPLGQTTSLERRALENELAYRSRIERLFKENSGEPFENGSLEHCHVLLSIFLANTTGQLRIMSGGLNPRVYGQPAIVEMTRSFLQRDRTSLCVLVESLNHCNESHPLFAGIGPRPRLHVRLMPKSIADLIPFHFMVADSYGYRLEPDKTLVAAYGAFGDVTFCTMLASFFDRLFAASGEVAFPAS